MGIPSFYKHLIQTVGGLTSPTMPHDHGQGQPQVFALDLNCAIYHCARTVGEPSYSHETRVTWEDRLIQHVLGYILAMTRRVGPTEVVYIAVDGVAPMAKIKQQRARRFKSSVLAAEEAAVKGVPLGERWDTNAITPGTAFMERLGVALRDFRIPSDCNGNGPRVIVSAADEAGEGEQKIMTWLRQNPNIRNTVIYGLDADLIVLALLEHGRSGATVNLFREETEFGSGSSGGVKRNALGEEQYLYLLIAPLVTALYGQWGTGQGTSRFLQEFAALMNLLGNDFVPHGMALKINDEGMEHLLEVVKGVGSSVLTEDGRSYAPATLATVLERLAAQEERWILRGIRRKLEARVGVTQSTEPAVRALAVMNDRPVEWAAERCLVEQRRIEGYEKPAWFLGEGWRTAYATEALDGCDVGDVVRAYFQTLTWTLRYYLGEPVPLDWYYPWQLPPLFRDLAIGLRMRPEILDCPPLSVMEPLQPLEQLAMVLPVTSFSLLPVAYQDLPLRYPWAWPTAWSLFSLGRRFLWECEPRIPLLNPHRIRQMLGEMIKN